MAILAVCFLGTAISIRENISLGNVLFFEAKTLENHLQSKEHIVANFLKNENKVAETKTFNTDYQKSSQFLENFDKAYNIHLLVFHKDQLEFWSSFEGANLKLAEIPEGSSFLKLENGWFEIVKKTFDDYTLAFLIKVKNAYYFQNQYLTNEISKDLLNKNNVDIASFSDKNIANIQTYDGKYLFSVKLKNKASNNFYTHLSLWSCILGILCLCMLINNVCKGIADKGYYWSSVFVITFLLGVLRISDLYYGWLDRQYNVNIFDPKIYAQSFYLPSLGDFLINTLLLTWVLIFAFRLRKKLSFPHYILKHQWIGIIFFGFSLLILAYVGYKMDDVFFGLIENSKINLKVANIMIMNMLSLACIFILCLTWLNLYAFISILFEVVNQFQVSFRLLAIIFATGVLIFILYYLFWVNFTIFFLVFAIIIAIRGYHIFLNEDKFHVFSFIFLLFCCAVNSSIKFDRYNRIKERNTSQFLAQKLEKKDQNALLAIPALEKDLRQDAFINNFFENSNSNKHSALQNYILKKYLSSYLSKYEFNLFEFDSLNDKNAGNTQSILDKYISLSRHGGATKLSESSYFYEVNDTFGYQIFFGLVPILSSSKGASDNYLLIELKSKPIGDAGQLPDLLVEGKAKVDEEFKDYSIGFFQNGNLVNQIGKYAYQLKNDEYQKLNEKYTRVLNDGSGYSQMIYKSNNQNVIVISKKLNSFMEDLATLSFYFLIFIAFASLFIAISSLLFLVESYRFNWLTFNRSLILNANRILYKTRIQFSMVMAVVSTLFIIAWVTFFYVSKEYREQQNLDMNNKITSTVSNFEKQFVNTKNTYNNEQSVVDFNYFAEVNGIDLNYYDTKGDVLLSTLPKLYQKGIVMPKMDALSYITMNDLNRSQFINLNEKVGDYTFAAAYAPIRNASNVTVGYLGIPFFSNEIDYKDKINLFINTLINVYALAFVGIGFLAVAIANQITAPLTMIQQRMRDTQIGQSNRAITWRRQDEIGALIKEYNAMIAALEESARKLALSERENAWREMAKQVAHEIKNPLTPLKLGVQLLERSWKAGDENFAQKFERFSSSFIEQIDSLSKIATEFSDFAKMPQTQFQYVEITTLLQQAVSVFQNIENAHITLNSNADKILVFGDRDQLLRAFNNLLKNAIEAKKNHINMQINILLKGYEKFVELTFTDNGTGIPSHLHQQIFTPNFTTKSSGTGLGLAFVKQAVENCNGSISFTTHINEGTTFFISLPLV